MTPDKIEAVRELAALMQKRGVEKLTNGFGTLVLEVLAERERMLKIVRGAKRGHYMEDDYVLDSRTCKAHEAVRGIYPEKAGPCTCGADAWNAEIDALLEPS